MTLLNEHFAHKGYLFPSVHWYEYSFYDVLNKASIEDDFKALISGLDDSSIEVVSKIINRIRYFQTSGDSVFCLSDNEVDDINANTDFINRVVCLNNELYAYKNYLLPKNYFEYGIFEKHYYVSEFSKIDRNKHILDVGAFIGDSAIVLKDYTDKKVFAFEPFNENYEALLKTIELNNTQNIVPMKLALSDEENCSSVLYGNGLIASNCANFNGIKSVTQSITLDKWVSENNVDIGLIKIDIESGEQKFLKGAFNTIKLQRPNMIISIYHGGNDFFGIKPLIESWDLGYRFKIIKTSPCALSDETVLLCDAE